MCERFQHEELPADGHFDFKGYRFKAPFHCMCCGKEVCWKQWAYGRYCATCDTGICHRLQMHPMTENIFCGANTELIDAAEAEKFNFREDRMKRVPPAEPVEWREIPSLFSGGDYGTSTEQPNRD
jgi:hypothetical protein